MLRKRVLAMLSVVTVLAACSKDPAQSAKAGGFPAAPVTVARAEQKTVPVTLSAIGNVEAFSLVSVKSQVEGILSNVRFKEGQDVNKGELLFTIDSRPYEAMLRQAEANLARDRAQMENAKKEAHRYEGLIKSGYVAKEQYEQVSANSEALEAVVKADLAAVENARLQRAYCYIRSPVSGRTGSLLVNEGNLIKANADNPMVVISQVRPIYINFAVPEHYFGEIKRYAASGRLAIKAVIPGDESVAESGGLSFIDNTVDSKTGTIRLKGIFQNVKMRLWPGQFVNVTLYLTSLHDAVVVPSHAVLTGQQGAYVYVVKNDMTAEMRLVQSGLVSNGETVIERGLNAGETVVTDGQMLLAPGAKVEIKKAAASTQGTRK